MNQKTKQIILLIEAVFTKIWLYVALMLFLWDVGNGLVERGQITTGNWLTALFGLYGLWIIMGKEAISFFTRRRNTCNTN